MTIAFLFETPIRPHKGGIERVSFLLATQFKTLGNDILFISTTVPTDNDEAEKPPFKQISFNGNGKAAGSALQDIIMENNIDVIINQSVIFTTIKLLPYIKASGKLLITVLHNRPFCICGQERHILRHTYPQGFKDSIFYGIGAMFPKIYGAFRKRQVSRIYKDIVKYSDRFILLSESFKPRLIEHCPGIDIKRIDSINNPNTFPNLENTECSKQNIVIFVGRLEDPQKNVTGFIDVWNEFSKSHADWQAYIIGEGRHREYFEKYALEKESRNLTFVGNRKDVASFYSSAKYLCMTSSYEGWPMVLAEAMAYGCVPFVYDTFESCHDIITQNNGFIIEPYDSHKMAKAMNQLSSNEEAYLQMSINARRDIARFTPEIIAKIWIDKISQLMKESRSL